MQFYISVQQRGHLEMHSRIVWKEERTHKFTACDLWVNPNMWCLGQARRAGCNGSGVVVSSLYIHLYWTYMGFQYRWQILPLSQTLKLTLRGTLFIEHFGFVQTNGFLSLTRTFDFLCKLVLVYEISLLSPMTQQPCLGLQEELWNESSKIWDMGVSVLFACKLATLTTFNSVLLKTLGRIFVTHGGICFISPLCYGFWDI